ncbi:hypothetical protein QQZ08_001172 [Neonectria magnoliae]|uniref:Clr5 domain-containing protein n=1 Tax=Neonectria magnoliae TaxID=2732573 RepID=A0ABR1IHF8_9HYPO
MPVNWSPYEAEVLKLYVEERKTAKETLECLNQQHGTKISSIQQFKRKFDGLKKLRAHEWQEVDREILKRRDQGKTSDVYICGQRQEPSRIKRALEHSRTKEDLSGPDWAEEICKRRRVEIRTPEPLHFPRPEIENFSAIPAILENPAGPGGLESEPPIAIENEGFVTDLGINLDDIELDFSTPKLDHQFLPNLSSSSNPLGPAEINSPSNSLPPFPAAQDMIRQLPLNEQVPLHTRSPISTSAMRITSHFSPKAPGSNPLFSRVFIPDTLNIRTGFPAVDWNKLHARVPQGKAGWLESQLLSMDSNVMLRKPTVGLLEDILHNTTGKMEIRVDGYNRDSLHQMFTVVTHLVSNKLLDWRPLLNFTRWAIENDSIAELFSFLQKDLCNKSNLVREVLNAISIEAERFGFERAQVSYSYEHPFYVEYQLETSKLIHEADNRILSGTLGDKLLLLVAKSQNLKAVKFLVDSGVPIDHLQFSSQNCLSPLCGAVHGGSTDILEYLLGKGADVNECFPRTKKSQLNKQTVLTKAVEKGNLDMVRILLRAGAKVLDDLMIGGISICEYARRTSVSIHHLLQESLELGLASGDAVNLSLLVEAAEMGNSSLSQFLLKYGIVRQEILEAGLCRAIGMRNVGAVRTLLRRGIDPNAVQYRQKLHLEKCSEDTDDDSDDDSDDDDLETEVEHDHPLFQALGDKYVVPDNTADMVYLLIKAGATVYETTLAGMYDKLQGQEAEGQEEPEGLDVLIAMVQARFNVSVVGPCALEEAATQGSIAKTGALLDAGVDINAYGGHGRSALQAASDRGHLALVQYLLEQGADVNLPASGYDEYRTMTALQAAARGGSSEVVDCLLEAGADVRAPPAKKGLTVLEAAAGALVGTYQGHESSREERTATFKKLLTRSAPVTRTDGTGCSVLHSLVRAAEMQCLNAALEAGANTEDNSSSGPLGIEMTPFQVAATLHNIGAMQLLLDHDANINAPASNSSQGCTALQAAIDKTPLPSINTEATVQFLLRNNADVNGPAGNSWGRTALQAATSAQPNAKIVALLLQHGADVNADPAGEGGITALQGAAISGDIQIAKILLAHGANVNAPGAGNWGRTAIEGAAEHGRLDMVRLLLDSGATPDANDGFTKAIKLAEGKLRFDIADFLRERQREHEPSFIGLIDQPAWNSELLPLDLDVMLSAEHHDTLQL